MQADACEVASLEEAGLQTCDVVIACTGDDKVNLVVSLLAKTEFAVGRVVGRVNDPRNEWLFTDAWGVDVAVSTPRDAGRPGRGGGDRRRPGPAVHPAPGSGQPGRGHAAAGHPLAGAPVRDLQLPRDAALVTILRGGRVIVPQPDEPLEPGDELLFVATSRTVEEEIRARARGASQRGGDHAGPALPTAQIVPSSATPTSG